jgi:16S rRNA (uracil1498-N3)-methyltransferase
LRDVLKQNAEARKVDIYIGPEGGFAENEIQRALSAGAKPVSLGSNILRTETAAIVALSIVLYEKDFD